MVSSMYFQTIRNVKKIGSSWPKQGPRMLEIVLFDQPRLLTTPSTTLL